MKFPPLIAVAVALLALGGALPASAGTREGIAYFKHGMFAEALKELEPEAKNNDPAALNILGKMYSAGLGVPKDVKTATAYFKRGAELGDAASQNDYGAALALGDGVDQDVQEALKWLMLSSRQGHQQARQYVERLVRYMPRADIAAVRRSVIEWEVKRKKDRDGGPIPDEAAPSPATGSAPSSVDEPPSGDLPLPSGTP